MKQEARIAQERRNGENRRQAGKADIAWGCRFLGASVSSAVVYSVDDVALFGRWPMARTMSMM